MNYAYVGARVPSALAEQFDLARTLDHRNRSEALRLAMEGYIGRSPKLLPSRKPGPRKTPRRGREPGSRLPPQRRRRVDRNARRGRRSDASRCFAGPAEARFVNDGACPALDRMIPVDVDIRKIAREMRRVEDAHACRRSHHGVPAHTVSPALRFSATRVSSHGSSVSRWDTGGGTCPGVLLRSRRRSSHIADPGPHFAGASATLSFGPLMRFVVGTWHAAPAVARSALGDASARSACRTSRGSASDPDPVSPSPGRCPEAPNSMRRLHSEAECVVDLVKAGARPAQGVNFQAALTNRLRSKPERELFLIRRGVR